MVSNIACGINLTFSWQTYVGIFLGVLVLYGMINGILMGRVNKILPAQALKMREWQREYFYVIKALEENFQETEV